MEVNPTVIEEIIVDSIVGYNDTVVRGKNSVLLQKNTHDEKVGLFYNTLRRNFQYKLSGISFDRYLKVHHISCTFKANGELKTFKINDLSPASRDSWRIDDQRLYFFCMVDICKAKFSKELSSTRAMIKLDDIINSIKT